MLIFNGRDIRRKVVELADIHVSRHLLLEKHNIMGSHPLNLGLRFVLELIVLASACYWVWSSQTGWQRNALIVLLPVLLAAVWGCFAVPNDPSRSGQAVIAISGIHRLILELTVFFIGFWFLYHSNLNTLSWLFAIAVIIHYVISYDRIAWLIKQ